MEEVLESTIRESKDVKANPHIHDLAHSHSIVDGGFELMSYTTRLMPRTSLTMRDEMRASSSCGRRAQSAVMPSRLSTARIAAVYSYVRSSPITPTLCTGSSTAKLCHSRAYHPSRFTSSETMASARRNRLN